MKTYERLNAFENMTGATSVALGNFDGVHVGHRELIKKAVVTAKEKGLTSVVFAFSENPKESFGIHTKKIISAKEKTEIIADLGVDVLINIPFDKTIRKMHADEFVDRILVKKLKAKEVFCGFNYRFGYKAQGNSEYLFEAGGKNFSTTVLAPYAIDGELVSSSKIRQLIEAGEMEKCTVFLGRNFAMEGKVVEGNKLGKTIGFATANMDLEAGMISPATGVYITRSVLKGKLLPSITNVGYKPTTGKFEKNVETHLLDFDADLYGALLRVEFIQRLRGEIKFNSLNELKASIARDRDCAVAYHSKHGNADL